MLSDGGDNCAGDPQEQLVSRLGDAAKSLLDRGVRSFAIRYGSMEGETPEAAEQLNAISTQGGTAPANSPGGVAYIEAKTPEEMGAALTSISDQLRSHLDRAARRRLYKLQVQPTYQHRCRVWLRASAGYSRLTHAR